MKKCSKHNIDLSWDAIGGYHYCERCTEEFGLPARHGKILKQYKNEIEGLK